MEQYFNPSKMNENVETLIKWIDKEYCVGNKELAIRCYKILHETLQNEINLNLENGLDPEERTKGLFKIRELNCIARQKIRKKGYQVQEKQSEDTEDKIFEIISNAKERNQSDGR